MDYCGGTKRFEQKRQHRGGVGGKSEGTQFSSLISLYLFSSLFFPGLLTSRHTPLPERLTQAFQKEIMISGARFSKVQITFGGSKSWFVFVVIAFKVKISIILRRMIQRIYRSAKEGQLTGLWARNYTTILQVLILEFALGPEKFRDFRETGPRLGKDILLKLPLIRYCILNYRNYSGLPITRTF